VSGRRQQRAGRDQLLLPAGRVPVQLDDARALPVDGAQLDRLATVEADLGGQRPLAGAGALQHRPPADPQPDLAVRGQLHSVLARPRRVQLAAPGRRVRLATPERRRVPVRHHRIEPNERRRSGLALAAQGQVQAPREIDRRRARLRARLEPIGDVLEPAAPVDQAFRVPAGVVRPDDRQPVEQLPVHHDRDRARLPRQPFELDRQVLHVARTEVPRQVARVPVPRVDVRGPGHQHGRARRLLGDVARLERRVAPRVHPGRPHEERPRVLDAGEDDQPGHPHR